MKIAFDVMGFENDITEAINAARKFVKKYSDVSIILVGSTNAIKSHLKTSDKFEVINATQVINMEDGILDVRRKPDSSMNVAVNCVKSGQADAILSAGSTASFVAATFFGFGLIDSIKKVGFMPWMPTINSKTGMLMVDVGANKECTGEDLQNFAIMAEVYSKNVLKVNNPIVRVLNIGVEASKGLELHQNADKLLKQNMSLNYQGFVEPRDILFGGSDIVVCDGYSGNLVIKAFEGSIKMVLKEFMKNYKNPVGWLGMFFSTPFVFKVFKKFDYRNNAAALVIGLKKIAIKAHGAADERQFYSALEFARNAYQEKIIEHIENKLTKK